VVEANDALGRSSSSEPVRVRTAAAAPPPPTDITVRSVQRSIPPAIRVSWTPGPPANPPLHHFHIELAAPYHRETQDTANASVTTATFLVQPSTDYMLSVWACTTPLISNSPSSDRSFVRFRSGDFLLTPAPERPMAPTDLVARGLHVANCSRVSIPGTCRAVLLSWRDRADNETRFEVEWTLEPPSSASRSWTAATTSLGADTEQYRFAPSSSALYYFRVRACHTECSTYSNEAMGSVP
jgi:hypothetical protein